MNDEYYDPNDPNDDGFTEQDLRDQIEMLVEALQRSQAAAEKLKTMNEAITMDLILISATLGVTEPNMTVVMSRISELLDREQAYMSITKGE